MKKLIPIFGAFAIICVIISFVTDKNFTGNDTALVQPSGATGAVDTIYTVKSENGRIVVYEGDNLITKTATAVNTLPKKDQKVLLYGIQASTQEEVEQILRDFCS